MVLPASGNSLSLNQLHVEAGGTSGTLCSLNDEDIRSIIGVSSNGSQNIQQYYGQSATPALASSVEVVTLTNTTSTNLFSFSFPGGVSDHDVIFVGNFNYAGPGSSYPSVQSVSGARFEQTNSYHSFAWSGSLHSDILLQHIVCGASTSNSFTWNAGGTWSTAAQAAMVAIKYSTDGTTSINQFNSTLTIGTSSLGGSIPTGVNRPSNSSDNNHQIPISGTSIPSPNSSTQDGMITVAFKGGNNANDWSFDRTGDVNGTVSMHNYNDLKYYAKADTVPSSGNYSATNIGTGWGGTSWIVMGYNGILTR